MPRSELPPPPPPRRPMFGVALALLAGMSLGLALPLPLWLPIAAGAVLICLATARLWRSRRVDAPELDSGLLLLGVILLLGWGSASQLEINDRRARAQTAQLPPALPSRIRGVLAEEPVFQNDNWQLVLRDVEVSPQAQPELVIRLAQRIRVTVVRKAAEVFSRNPAVLPLPGQPVELNSILKPFLPSRTPAIFNSPQYWRSQAWQARATIERPEQLRLGVAPDSIRTDFLELMRASRGALGRAFERELPAPQAALARAFVLGEAERLPRGDRDLFRDTGLSHLMAVSGFNVALVMLVFVGLARVLGAGPRTCAGIGMATAVMFAALTGFEAPVTRAAMMALFVLAGMLLGRHGNSLAGLSVAVVVSLWIEPRNLLRIDWQLSYACVASLILFTAPLLNVLNPLLARAWSEQETHLRPLGRRVMDHLVTFPLAATLAVQIGLMPLQIYYFQQLNLLFPINNLVGIALGIVLMVSLTMLLVFAWLPGVVTMLAWTASVLIELLRGFLNGSADLTFARLHLTPLSSGIMLLFYMVLLSGIWLRWPGQPSPALSLRSRRSFIGRLAFLLLLLIWVPIFTTPAIRGGLDVWFLDVGQGDAIVVRAPNARVMVVDAGRNHPRDEGRFTMGPFLETLGIQKIDVLVATHADADHIGGIPSLLRQFDVEAVLHGQDDSASNIYAEMLRLVASEGSTQHQLQWGERLHGFGALAITALGPVPGRTDNDGSVVLLLSHGQTDLLLTGDLESGGERDIIARGLTRDVEVLKLGHHGSKSSSSAEFLAALRPEWGIVSAGRNNRYGHPAPAVLERLGALGGTAFRTDQLGTLWLHSDGDRVSIYSYAGPP